MLNDDLTYVAANGETGRAVDYLAEGAGDAPGSRYGLRSEDHTPVILATARLVAEQTGDAISPEMLDGCASWVVNDSDAPADVIVEYGTPDEIALLGDDVVAAARERVRANAMPDLKYAKEWLTEMRNDLLVLREQIRLHSDQAGLVRAAIDASDLAEKHAATLEDIIARADIVPANPADEELPTRAQFDAIRRRVRKDCAVTLLQLEPFDLPAGYVLVHFADGFVCGISREGDVSS